MTMKERIFKNYVTTIIGVAIILFCAFMVYTGKASIQEVSGWFATGTLFIRAKDSLINLNQNEENGNQN